SGQFAQGVSESRTVDVLCNVTANHQGNGTLLFRNDNSYRIGFLCDTDGSAMPRSPAVPQIRIRAQRQSTPNRFNPAPLDHEGIMLHQGVRLENALYHLSADSGIQPGADFHVFIQPLLTLQNDQAAEALFSERHGRLDNVFDDIVPSVNHSFCAKQRRGTNPRERPADITLKDNNDD